MGRVSLMLTVTAVVMATVVALDTPQQEATQSEAEPALPPSVQDDLSSRDNREVLELFKEKEDQDREDRLIAFYTTKTKALIVTSTAFALSTCFSTTDTPACNGRRRKRDIFNDQFSPVLTQGSSGLESSLDGPDLAADSEPGSEDATGRKFTVWSTSFSTYTVVSTSYYQGTTISVSALCNPGIAASCWG